MSVTLRPYQEEAVRSVVRRWMEDGHRRQLVVLPTGTGKTITALQLAAMARGHGHRVLWLAHREELLDQPHRALGAIWPDLADRAGVVQAHRDAWWEDLVFASIDTVAREARLDRILAPGPFRLVVVDEAHHSAAGSWSRVLDTVDRAGRAAFRSLPGPDSTLYLGLTATPDRADGRPLGRLWRVAYAYPIPRAISEGYLVPPRVQEARIDLDLSEVAQRAGDWADDELEDALMQAHVVEHTVEALREHGAGRKALIFTVTVRQASATAEALCAAGIPADVVSGQTPRARRRELLQGLRRGDLRALANCAVLTEGYDDPSVDCVVIARPTRSKPLFVQMVGRGLRIHPGKADCLVIDLVGATEEHDLLVSSALLTAEREVGGGAGDGLGGGSRSKWSAFLEERVRSEFAWAAVPGVDREAWACNAGAEGTVALVEQDGGGWLALVLRRGGDVDYPAGLWPLDQETAQGCAEDFIRQAEAARLAGRDQPWRRGRSSRAQDELLRRLRITERPRDRGHAERLITGKLTQGRLVRLGLVHRTGRRGVA